MKIGTLIRQKTFAPPSSNKKQWRYGLIAPEDTTVTSYVTVDKYVTVMWQDERAKPHLVLKTSIEVVSEVDG